METGFLSDSLATALLSLLERDDLDGDINFGEGEVMKRSEVYSFARSFFLTTALSIIPSNTTIDPLIRGAITNLLRQVFIADTEAGGQLSSWIEIHIYRRQQELNQSERQQQQPRKASGKRKASGSEGSALDPAAANAGVAKYGSTDAFIYKDLRVSPVDDADARKALKAAKNVSPALKLVTVTGQGDRQFLHPDSARSQADMLRLFSAVSYENDQSALIDENNIHLIEEDSNAVRLKAAVRVLTTLMCPESLAYTEVIRIGSPCDNLADLIERTIFHKAKTAGASMRSQQKS